MDTSIVMKPKKIEEPINELKVYIISEKNLPRTHTLASFISIEKAIEYLNIIFSDNRLRDWLNNGSAIIEEKELRATKETKPIASYTIKITGEGKERIAMIEP